MGYRSLRECVDDLSAAGHLVRIDEEIDANLEAAAIHRRVYQAGGPAIYFARVRGCKFPMVSNLFGTLERARYIFRDALEGVRRLVALKIDPGALLEHPFKNFAVARSAIGMLPRRVRSGPVLANTTTIEQLPRQKSWPDDGGAFITLPQVYTEDVSQPGLAHSNLGMYRIQLSGGQYEQNREIGLHYQLHRGIGVHQTRARRAGSTFRVNIFVGGPPAMNLAAVMPLPEGFPEIRFAGALNRRRVRMIRRGDGLPIHAEADFCICGTVVPDKLLPEGPFGDHLGYYSLAHDFPVLRVEQVLHRTGAIWPFTVVGRPPQEDTVFGQLIHEITGPVIPTVIPGVRAVHAVDASGVHPLLLAVGSERYVPFSQSARPAELLTQANAILGQGQLSLAKYLWIANEADDPSLDIHDVKKFFMHMLRRVDWSRDLHFQTCTTIDTLDYSGSGLNEGSKVVIAAVGPPRRELSTELPSNFGLPDRFVDPRIVFPGVLAVRGPATAEVASLEGFCDALGESATPSENATLGGSASSGNSAAVGGFPLIVVVDDSQFTAATLSNFLWVTFTRSNPAPDVYGTGSFVQDKHWGCRGSLIIDARIKPHHAPPLVEDPDVTRRVDQLGAGGGPLHGII